MKNHSGLQKAITKLVNILKRKKLTEREKEIVLRARRTVEDSKDKDYKGWGDAGADWLMMTEKERKNIIPYHIQPYK